MPIPPVRRRWTWAEFEALPEDGNRYEVIAGELCVTPPPSTSHQRAVSLLLWILGGFADAHRLGWVLPGPVAVIFAEGDYLEPDLAFVRRERREIIADRGIEGPPDLVVEVLSPGTARRDRWTKRERYGRYGVPEYWIVDLQSKHIEVHDLREPGKPAVVERETLKWRLTPDFPELTISLPDVVRGFD